MIGFILVDKPPGPTSHDVVDVVRRRLGTRKVGHAGTLDPPASGLMVVAVGPATRLLQYVQRLEKTYEATGVLGIRTTTLDATGEVVSSVEPHVGEDELRDVLASFVGEIDQVPPAVSAVRVGGERAYKRAARGESVELESRRVRVYELVLLGYEPPRFSIRLRCSAGTYVRSIVDDAGERLGCGAHVAMLRRNAVGEHAVEAAVALEKVGAEAVLPVESVLPLPRVDVDAGTATRARWGQRLGLESADGEVLVVGPDGPVGVFRAEGGVLRPLTVLGAG